MLPTQTSSEHRNFTVVGREKISYASDSAKDTFFIVECVIISTDGTMSRKNSRVLRAKVIPAKLMEEWPRPQRYVFIKNMSNRGIPIARRTVAKYRTELNILPSNMRKYIQEWRGLLSNVPNIFATSPN
jgi:Sigma-54, DNA binding domain